MRFWRKAAVLAAALVCVSCGPRGRPRACSGDADCSSGSYCEQGVCIEMRADDCRRVACSVAIVAPSSMAYTEGAVAFQVGVSGTVADSVELLRDGEPLATLSSPYQYTWDTSNEVEGAHEIVARATQGPSVFTSEPRTVVVSRATRTIAISTPSATVFTAGQVAFQLTVTGIPPDTVELLKNGAVLATLAPPYEYTWDTAGEAEGTYQLVARGVQGSVVFTSEPRVVVVSRATRAVAISTPATTTFTNGQVGIQLVFSGPAPEKVELLRDGVLLAAMAPPYAYTWDTAREPEGSHQIVARATQGGTTYSSDPRTIVVDRTPPVVVAQSPAPGDTNVALRAPIYVQFSEPVKLPVDRPGSVVSMTGAGGAGLSTNVALSSDHRRLLVSYVLDPAVPSDIALSLAGGITDLAGNPLTLPAPWGWHMPMWQRLGPYVRQAPSIGGYDLAVDASGRPTVAWVEADTISVSRWTGDSWQVIGSGIRGPGSTISGPVIALQSSGDPVLAWTEDTNPEPTISNQVIVQHMTPSGWEYLGQNPIGPPMTTLGDLAIDAGGGVWLGTVDGGAQVGHAVVRKYDGALYWQQQGGNLNRAERNATAPKLAFDAGGSLWAAWTESTGTAGIDNFLVYGVFASKLLPGGWSSIGSSLNDNLAAPAYNVKLTNIPGGFPAVTWYERLGSFNYRSWYRVGGAFGWGAQQATACPSAPTPPLAAGRDSLYSPACAAPYVVYRSPVGQAGWSPLTSEESRMNPSSSVSDRVIRATASGDVLLLWRENDASGAGLYVNRLNH